MHDPMAVAQRLVERIQPYADQVDLVCIYGSRARGDARPDSDLDIYYVPAENCSPPVGKTFLYDGLLYDFWGLSWETLEGFATGSMRGFAYAPALVAGSQPIWQRDEAAMARLDALKAEIARLESPAARREMVGRALDQFATVTARLGILRHAAGQGGASNVRFVAWGVVEAVMQCLALANQVHFDRGFAKSLAQVERLPRRPADLVERIERLLLGEPAEVPSVALALVDDLRALLIAMQAEFAPAAPLADAMADAYPELKDALGKVLAACRVGDRLGAAGAANSVQFALVSMLAETAPGLRNLGLNTLDEMSAGYRAASMRDLLAAAEDGLDALADAVIALDARLQAMLAEHGVSLGIVASLDEL